MSGRLLNIGGLTRLHESYSRRSHAEVTRLLIMNDDASYTDIIHVVWPHNVPVKVRVSLLSCDDEVSSSQKLSKW